MPGRDAPVEPETVAEALRPLMEEHHMSVVALAFAAGVDTGYLRRILDEKPKSHPTQMSIDAGIKVAWVFKLPPDRFAVIQAKRLVFDRVQALKTQETSPTNGERGRPAKTVSQRRNWKRVLGRPKT